MKRWHWIALVLIVLVFVVLRRATRAVAFNATAPDVSDMPTLTKKKVPARRPVKLPKAKTVRDEVSGLAVTPARPGQKPVTSADIKALMTDFP